MLTLFTDRCFACEIIFSAVDIICTAISIVFYHRDSFHLLKILWLLLLAVQANLLYLPVLNWPKALFNLSDDTPNIEDIFKEKLSSLEKNSKVSDLDSHPKVKEFREKLWNIHHQGEPMPQTNTQPGTQDEDIIMSQVLKKYLQGI